MRISRVREDGGDSSNLNTTVARRSSLRGYHEIVSFVSPVGRLGEGGDGGFRALAEVRFDQKKAAPCGAASFAYGWALLVRVLVGCTAVSVRVLAVVVSGGGVFSALLVIAVVMMVGCLSVVMRGRLMMRCRIVMVLAGHVLLFSSHG